MSLTAVSKALSLVTGRERASTSLGHLLVSVGVLLWSSAWAQRNSGRLDTRALKAAGQ